MKKIRIRTKKGFEMLEGISAATITSTANFRRVLPKLISDFNFNQSKCYVFYGFDINQSYKLKREPVCDHTVYYAFDLSDLDETKSEQLRNIGFRWFDDIADNLRYNEMSDEELAELEAESAAELAKLDL